MAGPESPPVIFDSSRTAGLRVDAHGQESIGQADSVGSGIGGNLGHLRDGGDIGRELDDQRPPRVGFGPAYQVFQ